MLTETELHLLKFILVLYKAKRDELRLTTDLLYKLELLETKFRLMMEIPEE